MKVKCHALNKMNISDMSSKIEFYYENEKYYIAINYNDTYYICTTVKFVLSFGSVNSEKIMKICKLWPDSSIVINDDNGNFEVKLLDNNSHVSFKYPISRDHLVIPDFVFTHEINTREFKNLIELCNDTVIITP